MKEQDIKRLKEFCEREGFELKRNPYPGIEFEISKKDPWEGVEFARCVNDNGFSLAWIKGKIYPIIKINPYRIWMKDEKGDKISLIDYDSQKYPDHVCFQPATEQEYIDQLIEE